jgi:hypothetical protein
MPAPTNGGRNGGRGIKNKDNKLIDSVSRFDFSSVVIVGVIPTPVDFYGYRYRVVTVLVLSIPARLETARGGSSVALELVCVPWICIPVSFVRSSLLDNVQYLFVIYDTMTHTVVFDPFLSQLREACPAHKQKELDGLVKSLKGDEEKIRQKIAEWWEEPVTAQEEDWEDVNKKIPKKKEQKQHITRGGRGEGRGDGRGRGRERGGRGEGRGRGGRGEGRGAGRSGERRSEPPKPQGPQESTPQPKLDADVKQEPVKTPVPVPVPVPVPPPGMPTMGKVRAPMGAWGRAAPEPAPAPVPMPTPTLTAQPVAVELVAPAEIAPEPVAPPLPPPPSVPVQEPAAPPKPSGNVWATKGSAHLIYAEKPKPPPAPVAARPRKEKSKKATPPVPPSQAATSLATGTDTWSQQPTEPQAPQAPMDMPPSPVVNRMPVEIHAPSPAQPAPMDLPKSRPPSNVLNMGHWETGDADDGNLDFGFGSFGDNDAGVAPTESAPANPPTTAPAVAPSPARPPPGLTMGGGMPPMPTNAVLVHELENKLEEASIGKQSGDKNSLPPQAPQGAGDANHQQQQQNYAQYGVGMYNYNPSAQGNGGFPGVPDAGGAVLGAQQPQQRLPQGAPPNLAQQQGGLYGAPPSAPSSGNAPGIGGGNNPSDIAPPAGMPPGMPNMPYNPALYYGQQAPYMGQHQGGQIGYNYGYGAQFGGAVQGGFGYPPQAMGQSGGYAPGPHYDDQSGQHSGGAPGGYQKNRGGGGYRGRNDHHNNNNQGQYQNQYNPQQQQQHPGGYGGQPYGMGYHGDHFQNQQRGGYGQQGGMQDPYAMQQQQQQQQQQHPQQQQQQPPQPPQQQQGGGGGGSYGGGFQQEDDQYKNRKSNRGGLQQFQQQGPPQQRGGQHPFGAQGQGNDSTQQTGGAAGWSNQGGGWGAGAPSWQGK